ncbi:isoaspartyl peptidase/L-asparaginase family protein [Terrimonas rubra]|uniref:Isoaspartyl peptidase/L-asparaginase family protein n=1 Tax=Terrimonas rubra TaxID=1035890 RepID=A0ABW6A3Q5_9BACT
MNKIAIAIHGGAGTILKTDLTPELEQTYTSGLQAALDSGYHALQKGQSAIEAVLAAVISLEDNPLFNAGKGSVFTKQGKHEMDAAIMDGSNLQAGAVAAIQQIKNPIQLALDVMRHTEHVMLSGQGALDFAATRGYTLEPDTYFFSQQRYNQWQQVQHTDTTALDHNIPVKDKKFGTVGAVAVDSQGNVAAATSTGGMTNKQFGRIGDSPIIGCGTYANNHTCAISCTGHGELFIRAVTAYDVSCLMEYKGLSLQEAMHIVVQDKLVKIGGEGGMIGVDSKGNTALLFNSEGMYRGVRDNTGINEVNIYK